MLSAMVEFTDILLEKRQFILSSIYIAICLLFICLLASLVQADRTNIEIRIQSLNTGQVSESGNESSNAVTNAFSQIADDIGHSAATMESKMLSGVLSTGMSITRFDKDTIMGAQDTMVFTYHGVTGVVVDTGHAIGSVFTFAGHTMGSVFGLFHGISHLSSIIHPQDHIPVPVITPLQIQQAALIQSDTIAVSVASMATGVGSACDDGNGNGGYPMSWCNVPMDTLPTIPYASESINRECTSYAYWYFTTIEGYTNFQAWGNAKYWATTSNYPTHTTAAIGAIAVETTGAYGHVAIVQALPGQVYAGQRVPVGYVLVSEMNYDWRGHFRYSYSPLSKFSSYIYP